MQVVSRYRSNCVYSIKRYISNKGNNADDPPILPCILLWFVVSLLLSGLALLRPRPTFSLFLSVCEFSFWGFTLYPFCLLSWPRPKFCLYTCQSSIQGSIGVSSAAQEAGMYVEADIHQIKCKLLVDTGATVSIVSNDIYQKINTTLYTALICCHFAPKWSCSSATTSNILTFLISLWILLLRIHSVPVLSIILTTTKVLSILTSEGEFTNW
jgi:hypothetical protein